MRPGLRAVIFDLDGTLVNSLGEFHNAANTMLQAVGLQDVLIDKIPSFIGNGQQTFIVRCLGFVGASLSHDKLAFATKVYEEAHSQSKSAHTYLYDGVVQVLNLLKEHNIVLGICTNRSSVRARAILADLNIIQFFSSVVGYETTPLPKPDSSPLLYCLEQCGVKSEHALFVGDSYVDAKTARLAGVTFTFHQNGFGQIGDEEAKISFQSFENLSSFLLRCVNFEHPDP